MKLEFSSSREKRLEKTHFLLPENMVLLDLIRLFGPNLEPAIQRILLYAPPTNVRLYGHFACPFHSFSGKMEQNSYISDGVCRSSVLCSSCYLCAPDGLA